MCASLSIECANLGTHRDCAGCNCWCHKIPVERMSKEERAKVSA